jgi:lipoprotein-anchoring transpeptidase ErfK/SrfK
VRVRRRGETPPCPPSLGGPFGIQGNFFTVSTKHCTDGAIAISNADVIELWRHAPVGTPVSVAP